MGICQFLIPHILYIASPCTLYSSPMFSAVIIIIIFYYVDIQTCGCVLCHNLVQTEVFDYAIAMLSYT